MSKLALAMIVKGDAEEAKLLDRCLKSLDGHVDAMYITGTYTKDVSETKEVERIAKKHGAVFSSFQWVKHFAKARNYNFSQVPKEYEYILWCDADDVWEGAEMLKKVVESYPMVDAIAFWYLYDFDEYKKPTVVHKKTQIVRNDGCVEWAGELHEDFKENRSINVYFSEDARRIHLTDNKRAISARDRNVEIATDGVKMNPEDPRTHWNLANSYVAKEEFDKARVEFDIFLKKSSSLDEKYIAMMRLADIEDAIGNKTRALELLWMAIGMKPDLSDAFYRTGQLHFKHREWKDAEKYTKMGLILKPQYHQFIVYNPRDYDYNPMMLLAKIFMQMGRPDNAIPMLEGCLELSPKEKHLQKLIDELKVQRDYLHQAVEFVARYENEPDDVLKKAYEELDDVLKAHPAIVILRNQRFIKKETSGKDIVYYCGMTSFEWNPELFKTKGFGGSEEAVVNLASQWARLGYNVTVYNSCGPEPVTMDGVMYKPFWMFNYRDATDYLICWRHPRLLDYDLNAKKIFVDLHDVVQEGEFTEKRLAKIDKIFVKTQFHRSLFPNIPDDKFAIIPNGQDFGLFDQQVEKDQYLMVNTSSPDRSMDVLPELFARVKEKVPQAKLKWVYGFDNFKTWHANDPEKLEWMNQTIKKMEEVGIENLGRVTQKETARLLLEANIFAYPTDFAEIDCISAKKAQAAGAIPVVTDFGALDESVQYGIKVHSPKTKENWSPAFKFTFGLEDKRAQDEWVEACVKVLTSPMETRSEMKAWTEKFRWETIAKQWCDILNP